MISYTSSIDGIGADQLQGFFEGWPESPSPQTHRRLLESSDEIVLAIDEGADRVVGFITAITDRVLSTYILLLEVLPDYRRRGIGQELVRRMLERLKCFYMIDLICQPELQAFYERFGMQKATGMAIRDFAHQAGRHQPL